MYIFIISEFLKVNNFVLFFFFGIKISSGIVVTIIHCDCHNVFSVVCMQNFYEEHDKQMSAFLRGALVQKK